MSKTDYDIIIIGAGITGISAAKAIAMNGNISIAIAESKSVGSNNPSPLTFLEIVKEHDLTDCIKACYSSFMFHNYQGSSIKFFFGDYPLVVLDYQKACNKILSLVQQSETPIDIINNRAVNVFQDEDGVSVEFDDGSKINSQILIDCSGKSQLVDTQFKEGRLSYFSHVYGAIFSEVEDRHSHLACFLWPYIEFGSGGGWYYRLEGDMASFGYATISTSSKVDLLKLEKNFYSALKCFKPYSDYLKDANIENIEVGTIPITYLKKFVYHNIIVAGDAAGMATNWACMGIEPALKYGRLAGELSTKAILHKDYNILKEFQILWKKEDKVAHDLVEKHASKFWFSSHDFWEWIIKNDLAILSPEELLDRMRKNQHLLKKHKIITRALNYKIRSIIDKDTLKPQNIEVL